MNKDIKSYNSQQESKEDVQHVFLPSLLSFLLYLVVASLILLLLNAGAIWSYFNYSTLNQENFKDLLGQSIPVVNSLGKVAQGRVFLVFFWMIVGLFVYLLFWFIKTMAINFRNNIVVSEYFVHPVSFSKGRYWLSVLSRNLFFVANCVLLMLYIYAAIKLTIALGRFCYSAFLNFQAVGTISRVAISVFCVAVLLHLLFMLLHITIRSWRHAA